MSSGIQLPPEVLAVFREEVREHLEATAAELCTLEAPEGVEAAGVWTSIKRRLHNVKGAAGSVGFGAVSQVAHAAEDLVDARVDDADPAIIPRLRAAVAWLLDALDQEDADPAEALARLASETSGSEVAQTRAERPLPDRREEGRRAPQSGGFIRVQATTLEQLLPPVATLATHRGESAHATERLEELALRSADLADHAAADTLGPEEVVGLRDLARALERETRWARTSGRRATLALAELEDQIRRMRLVPFETLVPSLDLAVRDAAASTGKSAALVVEGGESGLDRRRLELIKSPLIHLMRNAVDHGIETPEERLAAGKPEEGVIRIRLETGGDRVVLIVEDDGAGIDLDRVRARALETGLVDGPGAEAMSDLELRNLLATPGFSTAAQVTALSGRGVGLDVVRDSLEAEGGALAIEPGDPSGTRFVLSLPADLLTTRVLRVSAAGREYALPFSGVDGTARVRPDEVYVLDEREYVDVLGAPARLHRLGDAAAPAEGEDGRMSLIVIVSRVGRVAAAVERILGEEEVVVSSLGPPFRRVAGLLGATVGESGQAIPVLNPAEILDIGIARLPAGPRAATRRRWHVLVVDDSITTRTLERHVLESHGHIVRTACDGNEAFEMLCERPADLVVSDVEMPQLDGIGLVRKIRADPRVSAVPVILVTSLASPEDQARGMSAGANAYIVKSRFDQGTLLSTIDSLLG